jgi:two-component system, OmpR family, phosphate regulon sensor histidine kinase PhoR
MLWPILTIALAAALVVVHCWWRVQCRRAEAAATRELEHLRQLREQGEAEAGTQREALFNSMVEAVLLLDQSGRIQLANRTFSRLFGTTGSPQGKTIMEAVRLHELADLVQSLDSESPVLGHELKIPGPEEKLLQVNAAAVINGGGKRLGSIVVFHEVTRLKKLERTREEFVANVSHELRTPLSLIKGCAETLLDGAAKDPEVAGKFLQTIDRNADRLKRLIEDLLTVSELESGRVRLSLQAVSLKAAVEKVLVDFKERAEAKRTRLTCEAVEFAVQADPERLDQVLCNLVDNSIKYGRSEGTVVVGAREREDGAVEIFVHDDGPGIPAESLERIFERFYRVDKARSREQGGTGLGLAIVKHIVQSHGGKVWATSTPGQGSSFHFTLPRATGGLQQALL